MFSADISVSIEEPEATLDVRGMNDLGDDRHSHTTWVELSPLAAGERIAFEFVETQLASPPSEELPTDSAEYTVRQEEYENNMKAEPLGVREMDCKNPNASVALVLANGEQVIASLESGREFLTFRLNWDQWRPERCRVSLSTFSHEEALARTGGRNWYDGVLALGESCVVEVVA